jgi:hypothetical protein
MQWDPSSASTGGYEYMHILEPSTPSPADSHRMFWLILFQEGKSGGGGVAKSGKM